MIPSYEETIRMIEKQFPEMEWLLRSNSSFRGKYFFHLHGQEFDAEAHAYKTSFKAWGATKEEVVWAAYSEALLAAMPA